MNRNISVHVEDYEAYYRKQKADSNCGFAEEFEVSHQALNNYECYKKHILIVAVCTVLPSWQHI